jgi:hypothetical protein
MKDVIWLTGMPRSGTNWVSQILASSPMVRLKLCPLFSYEFKNTMDADSSPEEWQRFFEKVYSTEGEYLDQEFLRRERLIPTFQIKEPNPRCLAIKSNRFHDLTEGILQKYAHIRFVALIRHPCAAIHSWLSNPLEFPPEADPKEEWRVGSIRKTGRGEFWGFDDWVTVSNLHLRLAKEWPERFFVARYQAFVDNAAETTKHLFDRLDLEFHSQTAEFLHESQSNECIHQRSVYKLPNSLDRWQHELDGEVSEEILAEIAGTEILEFLENPGC